MLIDKRLVGLFGGLVLLFFSQLQLPASIIDPSEGWIEIAHFDGTITLNASTYDGLGSPGDANYAQDATLFNHLGENVTIAVVMGDFTDFFRPSPGNNASSMLKSYVNHMWANSPTSTFVTPDYYQYHLGGSDYGWPPDSRDYIPFWGTEHAHILGGGGHLSVGGAFDWGREFTMHLHDDNIPEPSTLAIWSLLALCGIGYGWRRRKA